MAGMMHGNKGRLAGPRQSGSFRCLLRVAQGGMEKIMPPERRRLLYRAMHRGFKEADLILGEFAKVSLPTMTEGETKEFEQLLEVPDQELFGWIIGREAAPPNYQGDVLSKIQAFNVAEKLIR